VSKDNNISGKDIKNRDTSIKSKMNTIESARTLAAPNPIENAKTISATDAIESARTLAAPEHIKGSKDKQIESLKTGTLNINGFNPLNNIINEIFENGNITTSLDNLKSKKRYTTIKELGKGGIGLVLLVSDQHIGRNIAIKELLGTSSKGTTPSKSINNRFLREALVTGQLEHPSIIPVYDIDFTDDGKLFYTMREIKGQNLMERILMAETLRERLLLLPHFRDCCNAIGFAHSKGVIHRDIKPENIMIGEFGETIVLDWGLAKVLGEKDSQANRIKGDIEKLKLIAGDETIDGSTLGTPIYMPPEQALGKIKEIDELSDLYSLGTVLYEIITGKRPFYGANAMEILLKVASEPIEEIIEHEPLAPKELIAIVKKATAKEKKFRYQSVVELNRDVESYMAGDRIDAYSYSSWELFHRFVKKNRALMISTAVVVLALLGTVLFTSLSYKKELTARKSEKAAKLRAINSLKNEKIEKAKAKFNYAQALQSRAHHLFGKKRYLSAGIFAAHSMFNNPSNKKSPYFMENFSKNNPEIKTLLSENYGLFLFSGAMNWLLPQGILSLKRGDVSKNLVHLSALHISQKKNLLAYCGGESEVEVWNYKAKKKLYTLEGHKKVAYWADFSPNGEILVTGGLNGKIIFTESKSGKFLWSLKAHNSPVIQVVFNKRGNYVASSSAKGEIKIWNFKKRSLIKSLPVGRKEIISAILFVSGDKILVSAEVSGTMKLWDTNTWTLLHTVRAHNNSLVRLREDPSGDFFASVSNIEKSVKIWKTDGGTLVSEITRQDMHPLSVDFSPNKREILLGLADSTIEIYDLKTGNIREKFKALNSGVTDVVFSDNKDGIIAFSNKGELKRWRHADIPGVVQFSGHKKGIETARFSNTGLVASGGVDSTVYVWNSTTGKVVNSFSDQKYVVSSVAFSPDSKYLATASWDNKVVIHPLKSSEKPVTIEGHKIRISDVVFSPNGKILASIDTSKRLYLWNPISGNKIKEVPLSHIPVIIAFSTTGKKIYVGGYSGMFGIYNLKTGKITYKSGIDAKYILDIKFSSDGKLCYIAGYMNDILVMNIKTEKIIKKIKISGKFVNNIALSNDGKYIASLSAGHSLVVHSLSKGNRVFSFREKVGPFVSFDKSGRIMFNFSGSIWIIPLDFSISDKNPLKLINKVETNLGQSLRGFKLYPIEGHSK
jgi:eukaryotic-like serine/threonine-protein kinase